MQLFVEARSTFKSEIEVLKEYSTKDCLAAAEQGVHDSWSPLLRARTTKLEVMLVRAITKAGLTGKKLQKVLQGQQSSYLNETKAWHFASDPADLVWKPLWDHIKPLLG